jgi:hypothetical protein
MTLDELRERASAYLSLRLPPGTDPSQLIDECLTSARRSLRDEFILLLSPEAWARISLIYVTTFLESGNDTSIGEIFAAVIRDSLHLNRMEPLAQQAAQTKSERQSPGPGNAPRLTVVKS